MTKIYSELVSRCIGLNRNSRGRGEGGGGDGGIIVVSCCKYPLVSKAVLAGTEIPGGVCVGGGAWRGNVVQLHVANSYFELFPESFWRGPKSQEVGWRTGN